MSENAPSSYTGLINAAANQLVNTSETPKIDAEYLMLHVLGRPLAWAISHGDTLATVEHTNQFGALVQQRLHGTPIAYLIGTRDFWTLELRVNENVLIPRPDTETLVEHAVNKAPVDTSNLKMLDLGTGSGAIALSLAKEFPKASITAVDSENSALEVAISNAEHNRINNVKFIQSNWFESLADTSKYHLIASNPPYIEPDDPHLKQGDLRFEPETALVAKSNGLADLETIIKTAPNYLRPNGWLIVEHGYNQAESVAALFGAATFDNIELFRDLNALPRCTAGRLAK